MSQLLSLYVCVTVNCGYAKWVPQGSRAPKHHGKPMRWRQTREYKAELHGWETGEKTAAIGFRHTNPWEIPIGDGTKPVFAESLHEIRAIERESEKYERDGMGQAVRFRAFSQDKGNMQVNTFGEPPHAPKPQLYRNGKQVISIDAVPEDVADADQMGPGAEEALASALPMDPV